MLGVVVDGVAGLRVGVADLDAGFEVAGIVDRELGVEERDVALEGVEDLDTGFELEEVAAALEGVEDLTIAAIGLEVVVVVALEEARDVGVDAREGFDFTGNAGRLVGVAAREAGFRPPDEAGLLFAAADEESAGGGDSSEAFTGSELTEMPSPFEISTSFAAASCSVTSQLWSLLPVSELSKLSSTTI